MKRRIISASLLATGLATLAACGGSSYHSVTDMATALHCTKLTTDDSLAAEEKVCTLPSNKKVHLIDFGTKEAADQWTALGAEFGVKYAMVSDTLAASAQNPAVTEQVARTLDAKIR